MVAAASDFVDLAMSKRSNDIWRFAVIFVFHPEFSLSVISPSVQNHGAK